MRHASRCRRCPPRGLFHNAIRENAGHGFIYLNNPKVGCSTVKSALGQAILGQDATPKKGIHRLAGSPFTSKPDDAAAVERAYIFTFVRNPFQRLVSAYLNKVSGAGRSEWQVFAKRHGVPTQTPISFDGFVEVLSSVPPELHDPHWRPQHLNTLYPFVKPNLLGDLESLDQLLPEVMAHLFPDQAVLPANKSARSHQTAARQTWPSHLTDPATLARVLAIYAGDFDAFGYLPKVAEAPAPAVIRSDHAHPGLGALVAYRSAPGPEKAPSLRRLEQLDAQGALVGWVLAQRLRLIASNRDRVAKMLVDHAAQIASGPTYLRRIAEEVRLGPTVTSNAEL